MIDRLLACLIVWWTDWLIDRLFDWHAWLLDDNWQNTWLSATFNVIVVVCLTVKWLVPICNQLFVSYAKSETVMLFAWCLTTRWIRSAHQASQWRTMYRNEVGMSEWRSDWTKQGEQWRFIDEWMRMKIMKWKESWFICDILNLRYKSGAKSSLQLINLALNWPITGARYSVLTLSFITVSKSLEKLEEVQKGLSCKTNLAL